MSEGHRIPCASSPEPAAGHRPATGRKVLYIALGAVAVVTAVGALLVRMSIGPATKSDWPPPAPLLRLSSPHRVAATHARVYDASGRTRPLSEVLAERGESLERVAIGGVLESTIPRTRADTHLPPRHNPGPAVLSLRLWPRARSVEQSRRRVRAVYGHGDYTLW